MSNNGHKVLGMVLKGYPRISETFISNEIRLLERNGADIHIISMRNPREDFTHKSVREIRAKVSYLPSTIRGNVLKFIGPNLKALVSHPGNYLKTALFAIKKFAQTRKVATIKHFLQGGYVAGKVLPGSNIEHIHAHFAHSPTSVAVFSSRISGLPFSFTAHAKDIYTQKQESLTKKIRAAKFVVTCTKYNKNYLQGIAPQGKDVHCVYHGIDLKLFSTNGSRKPKEPYTVFTVARFTAKKGLPTVLGAVRLLRDQGLDVRHRIVGDGEDKDKVLAEIKRLGLEDAVTMLGTQTHEQVLEEFRNADVFAMGCEIARTGDRDGIPNVVAEAMAMGVPVAATRVSGIPELIEEEVTGLLADSRDPGALAKVIKRLLTDIELRARIIPAARAKVEDVFDNKELIRDLAGIYRDHQVICPEAEEAPR